MIVRTLEESKLSVTGSGNKVHWLVAKEDGSSTFEVRKVFIPLKARAARAVMSMGSISSVVMEGLLEMMGNIPWKQGFLST